MYCKQCLTYNPCLYPIHPFPFGFYCPKVDTKLYRPSIANVITTSLAFTFFALKETLTMSAILKPSRCLHHQLLQCHSRFIYRSNHWTRWHLIIGDPQKLCFPCLARKTFYFFKAFFTSFRRCNTERWIGSNNFNSIADPLYKALMHSRWYATIGMNPIPP